MATTSDEPKCKRCDDTGMRVVALRGVVECDAPGCDALERNGARELELAGASKDTLREEVPPHRQGKPK